MFIGKSMAIHFAVCSEKGQEVNSQKGGDLGGGVGWRGASGAHCRSPGAHHSQLSFTCFSKFPVYAESEKVYEQDI